MSHGSQSFGNHLAFAASLILGMQLALADEETTVVRLSEPVAVTDTYETFGAVMPDTVNPLTLSALVAEPDKYADQSVAVKARVAQVCQKKGCFFIAQDGATTVRVSFIDYSFFVPTDISGRQVTLIGKLQRVELTDKEAAHLQDDLATDDADVAPGPQFEIVASSVRVPIT